MMLIPSLLLSCVTILWTWNASEYTSYTAHSFFQRSDVQQNIPLDNPDPSLLGAAVFYASNEVRQAKNMEAFAFDPHLYSAALHYSRLMERENFTGHIYPKDRSLRTPMLRIEKAGGEFNATAENIARISVLDMGKAQTYYVDEEGRKLNKAGEPLKPHTYASLARMVVDGWMHSKGHRKNLMGAYTYLGCAVSGITRSADGLPEILITQNFGKKSPYEN